MAHWTVTVEDLAGTAALRELFEVLERAGVKVESGRFGHDHVHLELAHGAPTEPLAAELARRGLRHTFAPGAHLVDTLSPREAEMIAHLATGLQIKEVAVRMGIRAHTAREYWSRVKRKWDVKTVAQAVSLWTEHGPHAH